MREIVIRIVVPDGVDVQVRQSDGGSATGTPERRFPIPTEAPEGDCPIHGQPWKLVAGGVSKAGRAYDAFIACPERGCKQKPWSKAPAEQTDDPWGGMPF